MSKANKVKKTFNPGLESGSFTREFSVRELTRNVNDPGSNYPCYKKAPFIKAYI